MIEAYHDPEEALLPGEDHDLEKALSRFFGEQWLYTESDVFGGKSPYQMIGTADEYKVRNLLRTFVIAGIS